MHGQDLVLAVCCWILGFAATAKTNWMVQQARSITDRYPKAFSSRLPYRSWYPPFLRVMGLLLLLFGAAYTAHFILLMWTFQKGH